MIKFEIENTQFVGGWVRRPTAKEPLWDILDYLSETIEPPLDQEVQITKGSMSRPDGQAMYNAVHTSRNGKWTVEVGPVYIDGDCRFFITVDTKNRLDVESFLTLKYAAN